MALEQLRLATAEPDGADSRPAASIDGAGDDGGRALRLPRWTRQEILVLIQGKRVAENRVRRGRGSGGTGQAESKWSSVSSYCRRHGVNRGPVQCRKRWSNLAGDYKKIKEWEAAIRDEKESFWVMRNDLRRERRLPGFFDREVYDILDRGPSASSLALTAAPGLDLALHPVSMDTAMGEKATTSGAAEAEAAFISSRSAAATEDGLFSDIEPEGVSPEKVAAAATAEAAAPEPISEKQYESGFQGTRAQGTSNEEQPPSNPDIGATSQEARKRKRVATDDHEEATTTSLQYHLADALERNGKMLIAQLEAQNKNSQVDREQRKDQTDGLLAILNKLTDALVRMAEKL